MTQEQPAATAIEKQERYCPFNRKVCGPSCGCYITLTKPIINQHRGINYVDDELIECYAGCGLVCEIPWVTLQVTQPQKKQKKELKNIGVEVKK